MGCECAGRGRVAGELNAGWLSEGELHQETVGAGARIDFVHRELKRIGEEIAGEEIAEGSWAAWAEVGRVGLPHPDQVLQTVVVEEAVEEAAIELGGAVDSLAAGPPETVAVGLGIGIPEDSNTLLLKLAES